MNNIETQGALPGAARPNGLRQFLKETVLGQSWLRRYAVGYCTNNGLLHEVLLNSGSDDLRRQLNLPACESKSQLNQDVFALLMTRFRPGYFVEIGANDGYTLSNTNYLEQCFGWNGLLVEPNPRYTASLSTRKAKVSTKAVTKTRGVTQFADAGLYGGVSETLSDTYSDVVRAAKTIEVQTDSLANILKEHDAPAQIDFVSIDVEGGEVPIVEAMLALTDHSVACGCIEHGNREADKVKISAMLQSAGYRLVWPANSTQDLFFVNPKLA